MSAVPQTKQAHDYHVADLSLADWGRKEIEIMFPISSNSLRQPHQHQSKAQWRGPRPEAVGDFRNR